MFMGYTLSTSFPIVWLLVLSHGCVALEGDGILAYTVILVDIRRSGYPQ